MNPTKADHGYGRPSLRGVGSTLRGLVPYGTKSSRKACVLGCRAARLASPVRHQLGLQAIAGRARMAGRYVHLRGLVIPMHETSRPELHQSLKLLLLWKEFL